MTATVAWAHYDPADGRIVQAGRCDPALLALIPVPDGLERLVGDWKAAKGHRVEDGALVPLPPPEPGPPPPPEEVSALQIRRALRAAGLSAAVADYVATLSPEMQEDWEYATRVFRSDPMIEAARVALGLTPGQRDDLFRLAATL